MTGNFKILMVENNIDTHGRWYVHADNINGIDRIFYHLKSVTQLDILGLFKVDKSRSARMYKYDIIRPLTISEYITLGTRIKALNRRYNKKQDKLIDVW
jgi:hypothetical protein